MKKHYVCKIAVKPVVLTAGTVYQAFVNTDSFSMRLRRLHLQLDSADAGGGANSIFAFARITGVPNGGEFLTPTKYNTQTEPSKMLCLRNQSGLTMTGVIQDPYFLERSIVSKTTGSASNIQFDDEDGSDWNDWLTNRGFSGSLKNVNLNISPLGPLQVKEAQHGSK